MNDKEAGRRKEEGELKITCLGDDSIEKNSAIISYVTEGLVLCNPFKQ